MNGQDNSAQREAWNGIMGDSWSTFQDALDEMMQPVSAKLFAAADIKSGERVLDVGCGCGPTTIAIAKLVAPKGHVTGVDISGLLLQSARERSAKLGLPLDFIEADASGHRFTATYDKIFSRFGVMFFADPASAFKNLRTALRPGGKITFACWRKIEENPFMFELSAEVSKFVPMPPPPASSGYMPGPASFGDKAFTQSMLESAGFRNVAIDAANLPLAMPGKTLEDRIAFYNRIGPSAGLAREATEAQRQQVADITRRWVKARIDAGRTTQDGAIWLVRATN
ncbi:MAG TPA: class I SAM-dependent methyltransferase [Alphaproteobacteria bacterium]|nr:class I SAM-dependent methyltransferase [Alphaproteobacteria bacterium]